MKIELEVSDLAEIFEEQTYDDDDCVSVNGARIKQEVINLLFERLVEETYTHYVNDSIRGELNTIIHNTIVRNYKAIVEAVIERATAEIMKKKAIVEEMPKKSEVANISKEWENYFIELIDKAIAKRFK